MIPQTQEYTGVDDLEHGLYGDCIRGALASLLSLPIAEVPHFMRDVGGNTEAFRNAVIQFLAERGYCPWETPFPEMAGQLKHLHEQYGIDTYHLIVGNFDGVGHACVGLNGEIVHDPHPDFIGLNNPPEDWRIILLVSLHPDARP